MNDLADLQARIHAARQFTVTVGPQDAPRTIHLLEPDDHQIRLAGIRAGLRGADPAAELVFERTLLVQAIKGWSGVTGADLLHGFPEQAAKAGDTAVAYAPTGVETLLNAQREWGAQLWAALVERMAQRSAAREPAAKNS